TNTNDSNPGQIARQLMSTVGEAVANATAVEPTVVAWDPAWERFAGLYRNRWGDTQVVLLNERLVLMTPRAPSINDSVGLEPIGGGEFRLTAPTGGGAVGEVVRFVEENGTVVRMITGDSFTTRVNDQ
ncbi:MAG: serine hydrolase domain-containing protein, partial [Longimicrobiales bacterium]